MPHPDDTTVLVVNADDLGYAAPIDDGILRAHRDGMVRAASLLVTFDALDATLARLADHPGLDVGLHLNLTWGRALTGGATLVAEDGRLPGSPGALFVRSLTGRLSQADVRDEVRAQMARFADCSAARWHVDTHQHVLLVPEVARAVGELADHFGFRWIRHPVECGRGLGVRRAALNATARWALRGLAPTHRSVGILTSGQLDDTTVLRLLTGSAPGVHELVCHPGYPKGPPAAGGNAPADGLADRRSRELATLCDATLRERLERHGIVLAGWREL